MLKMLSAVALAIALPATAFAQSAPAAKPAPTQENTCAGHSNMAGMNMSGMDHSKMAGTSMPGMDMSGMDHSKMAEMDHSKMMGNCATSPKAGSNSDHQGHFH